MKRIIVFVFFLVTMLILLSTAALAADTNDFIVTGGSSGTDYTYSNGNLTFLKGGTYTISMRNGAAKTNNRIKVNAASIGNGNSISLTLDNLNIEWGSGNNIEFLNTSNDIIDVEFVVNGTNTITNTGYLNYCIYQNPNAANASVKVSGDGVLTLKNPNRWHQTRNPGDICYVSSFVLDSKKA